MARILIAWELGEAFGHVARCLQLADGLRQRGHSVVMTLKDLRLPAGSALPPGITLLPTPLTPRQRPPAQRMPINYADVLRHCGFAAVEDVTARLLAWHGIFSLARPAMLVADHAPTALLAARLAGIPALAIGNGFAIPPDIRPWPSIRPWETIPEEALVAAEQRLDGVTEAARKALGHGPAVRVRELFGAHDVLDTFAELDHYGARPAMRYVGPIVALPHARTVSWQTTGRAKLLAYLRPEAPGFTAILRALAQVEHLVRPRQMTREWILDRYFSHGRSSYRFDHAPVVSDQRLWGAERWLYRKLFNAYCKTAWLWLSGRRNASFKARAESRHIRGQILQSRLMHRSGES